MSWKSSNPRTENKNAFPLPLLARLLVHPCTLLTRKQNAYPSPCGLLSPPIEVPSPHPASCDAPFRPFLAADAHHRRGENLSTISLQESGVPKKDTEGVFFLPFGVSFP